MPFVATASDGSSQVPGETVPHPRSYGTFSRKIGRFAIEDEIITLTQAIRSSSGLPADILKLPERGYLKEIGEDHLFMPTDDAIEAIYPKLDAGICRACKVRIFKPCNLSLPNGEPRVN